MQGEKTSKKVNTKKMKPVYFNIHHENEKELYDWVNGRYSTFGGLVKDLLYVQMQLEKSGKTIMCENPTATTQLGRNQLDINDIIAVTQASIDIEKAVEVEEVEGYDC